MVPKPGKPINDVISHRPITLLPIPSKIFEKLLLKRLRSDVDLSALLPDYQFGFRAGHSTIHQTHRIVHEIVKSLEGKRLCRAVFLDVTKAFDKVWHTGLLYKIKTTLSTPYYLLVKPCLHTRFFQVKYNGSYSTCHEVLSGVPQGSVLGPLLYLIFTADLPTTDHTTIATFADDTGLLAVHCLATPPNSSWHPPSLVRHMEDQNQPGEVRSCDIHHYACNLPAGDYEQCSDSNADWRQIPRTTPLPTINLDYTYQNKTPPLKSQIAKHVLASGS